MRTLFIFLFIISTSAYAQLDCDITVNTDKIVQFRDQLQNFEQDIENYLNSQRWTNDDLGGEKIKCTISIFFVSASAEGNYSAQVFIGSQRPIFVGKNPSAKSTPLVRIFDDKWDFSYIKGQPLYRSESQFDALTDFLDFYAYLIVGFDYDSYEKTSGTPYFQKSYNVCNQAPSSAKGWDRASGNNYSRFQFIEDIVNPKFLPFREGFYQYHYRGLDLLATKPENGYKNMVGFLNQIAEIKKLSARNVLFKTFFETKYGELAEVFKKYSDSSIYQLLIAIDQAHQSSYEEAAKKR